MKLAVLTSTMSRKAGGLFYSVRQLHQHTTKEFETTIYAFRDSFSDQDLPQWGGINVKNFTPYPGSPIKFNHSLIREISQNQPDLIHLHGLWQGTSIACLNFAKNSGRPTIISPRGMLDSWALGNSRWKKNIAAKLFEKANLRKATCIHALCDSEYDSIRRLGYKNPIAVVPNGVELPEKLTPSSETESRSKFLLFLGRIHPKKGLLPALKGWKLARDSAATPSQKFNWKFVLSGWDQSGHLAELREYCQSEGIRIKDTSVHSLTEGYHNDSSSSVLFVGPAFESEKAKLLNHADAFILPSHSEGMPMAVLEAFAHQLPVIMTDECNIPAGFERQAAIRTCQDSESIRDALIQLFRKSNNELFAMGANGRELIEDQYTWQLVSQQMMEIYNWVLTGSDRPEFVLD